MTWLSQKRSLLSHLSALRYEYVFPSLLLNFKIKAMNMLISFFVYNNMLISF